MNLSELYGKITESQDGKKRGYVLGVGCAGCEIKYLLCCDDGEREFRVGAKSVISIGETVVYGKRTAVEKCQLLRLGKPAYDESGKFLGILKDYELKGFKLAFAVIGNKKYAAKKIISGDAIIIRKTDKKSAETTAKDMFINAVCGESATAE